ncbi:PepSY-associated TM helix domain-containing protein [Sphingobium sp. SCG-1]|uniref:PepSY-associated TM helix domain-containing protein n=1 Tax=Sphingobium sp. SCG-1 TaxID=2072936 RepID=UPI00166FA205|nr:PepSY domain-containing protein [Sphingobium sp. SCG-1]
MKPKWPDYSAIWRWHFYAGLFCIPFICWLAVTGSIYLFRPDIEAWMDRPYENLKIESARAAPSLEVEAALAAVKDSRFSRYEPPASPTGAAQIVVSKDESLVRIYVHPTMLKPMKIIQDDHRPMELLSKLHRGFLMGTFGSVLMEIAASWAIVMIITGLFLWFPRDRKGAAGVLYPRLNKKGRIYWRDLHAVTGMWVSLAALFMLFSGLPWSVAWGNYLTWGRNLSSITSGVPDWPVGGVVAKANGAESDPIGPSSMPGMTAAEMAAMAPSTPHHGGGNNHHMGMSDKDHQIMLMYALDLIVPAVSTLHIPRPIWVLPPSSHDGAWIASSQIQNRLERVTYTISGTDGEVLSKSGFADQNIVDKTVNIGVAAHEGHLFGRLNQLLLLLTASALIGMSVSAAVMWWRRKPEDALGAPRPVGRPRFTGWLLAVTLVLTTIIPLFGLTLVAVLVAERTVLRRIRVTREWLGLRAADAMR